MIKITLCNNSCFQALTYPNQTSVAAVEVPEAVDDGREVDAIVEDQSPLCWLVL